MHQTHRQARRGWSVTYGLRKTLTHIVYIYIYIYITFWTPLGRLHLCVRRSCWSQLLIPSHRAQNLVGMKPCTKTHRRAFLPDLAFPYLSARERVQESSLRAAESYPNILHAIYYTPCSQLSRHVLTHNHKPSEATLVFSH